MPGSRSMEMHQVRYFLAVAQLLNFTRAAEECHVTQPSLTRAIKQLEAELGGDLFRRERPTQMTELGQRMHPLLKQCYEAAVGARSLASSFKSGEIGALRIALTHSVDRHLFEKVLAATGSPALTNRAYSESRLFHVTANRRTVSAG